MKRGNFIYSIIIRYLVLILLGLPFIGLFYLVFSSLTVYPVYWILEIFYSVTKIGNTLFVNHVPIEIIEACIAGSAYYLFFILNLSTPNIKIKRRIKILLIALISFLIINILRIVILSIMFLSASLWFDFTHELFWYLLSTVFVIVIWFILVRTYKIKEIPFYSDIISLYKKSTFKKKKKK